ncbi:MAG: hypothetical protein BWY67_02301 [Bacteroidetes bacterium ADurb.Bin397]|nr:MAG: hypothetical protein BWY67_02301 [Bacteroidetes bacterium ADurb.Bin397]
MICVRSDIRLNPVASEVAFKYVPNKPTNTNAEPPINISASLFALYSFLPLPQIPISKYFGITATSRKKNIQNKSSEIKKPYAPALKRVSRKKNSLVIFSTFQETRIPASTTTAVSIIMAIEIPSTPI